MENERTLTGYKVLKELAGESSQQVVDNLKEFSPDFGKMMIEFGFGEVYGRKAFDLKQRELMTLTSLITQGAGERQLAFHFNAAMHLGWSVEEIIEIIIHCAAYSGFPKAAQAMEVLQQLVANSK